MILALSCLGGMVYSQEPVSPQPSSEPVSIDDMDYQIQLCKQYMENYKNQAYLFDQKAQNLLSHDFMGYRNAETMSQQCQTIADDLATHLQQLEKQRAEMVQRQSQNQTSPQK
jgi:hypothetical protein